MGSNLKILSLNPKNFNADEIIVSGGKLTKPNFLQRTIIQICERFEIISPYHNLKSAQKVAEIAKKILIVKCDKHSETIKDNLKKLKNKFVKNKDFVDGGAIEVVFDKIEEAVRFEKGLNFIKRKYFTSEEESFFIEIKDCEDDFRKAFIANNANNPIACESAREFNRQLSQLRLKFLKKEYGKLVKDVFGDIEYQQIKNDKKLLTISSHLNLIQMLIFKGPEKEFDKNISGKEQGKIFDEIVKQYISLQKRKDFKEEIRNLKNKK